MTEPGPGRRERKKEETKRRIYVAALELFHEKGFEHTTVDEITERADVAKGTFFNYFPHKQSVLAFLSEEWLQRVEAQAAQTLPAGVGGDVFHDHPLPGVAGCATRPHLRANLQAID